MSVTIDKTCELGRGSSAIIYRGTYGDRPIVAVKVMHVHGEKTQKKVKTDIDTMITCDTHENICRYFGRQDEPDTDRIFLALEFCTASLQTWMRDPTCISPSTITKTALLNQIIKGLTHLHANEIIHRDLKPTNILLAVDRGSVRVKLSDFGICKFLSGETSSAAISSVVGTDRWRAPEVLKYIDEIEKQEHDGMEADGDREPIVIKMKRVADIFSLGCIFYYVLKDRKHTFGRTNTEIRQNVLDDNPTLENVNSTHDVIGSFPLVRTMIAKTPEKRPPAAYILFHHMFWSGKEKLQFLVDVSNLCEKRSPETDQCSLTVETRYQSEICSGTDGWIGVTCPTLQTYLKTNRFRTYTGDYVMELARAIRNLQNHYEKLPIDIKQAVGNVPDEYIDYWLSRFPYLLHHAWIGFQPLKSKLSQYYPVDYDFSDY